MDELINYGELTKDLDPSLVMKPEIEIKDDLNNTELTHYDFNLELNCDEIKIYGFGSDGSVGASKDLMEILGNDKFVQGYFDNFTD